MEHAFIVPESGGHLCALTGFREFFLCLAEPVFETRDWRFDDLPVYSPELDDVIACDVDNDTISLQALKLSQEALCRDIRLLPEIFSIRPLRLL
jgi:hypothetical protein